MIDTFTYYAHFNYAFVTQLLDQKKMYLYVTVRKENSFFSNSPFFGQVFPELCNSKKKN